MKISEIRKLPTCTDEIDEYTCKIHESCLRAFQIVEKVRYYLVQGVPAKVILELMDEMECKEPKVLTDGPELDPLSDDEPASLDPEDPLGEDGKGLEA